MRTLILTSPAMTGADVKDVQAHLGLTQDGTYGPATGAAVRSWKWRCGFPAPNTGLGPFGQSVMFRLIPLPDSYRTTARARAAAVPKPTVRELAVRTMLAWAAEGVKEQPAGSNRVPALAAIAKDLGLSAWLQAMGWPWCAFSANLAALSHGGFTATQGLKLGRFNALYCPEIVHLAGLGEFGMRRVGAAQAQRGDLVLYSWDSSRVAEHVGRLTAAPVAGMVNAVEGNTGDTSAANGGAVLTRVRPIGDVVAFVRDS